MALQIRRGTAEDRLVSGIVPAAGELIYTTDDGNLFIGDGLTVGGRLLTGKIGAYPVEGTLLQYKLINNALRSGGIATYTTDEDHGLQNGDEVTISGFVESDLNGTFTVIDTSVPTEFTANTGGLDIVSGSGTGVLYTQNTTLPDGAVIKWDDLNQYFVVGSLDKADIGLGNVDNTADVDKPTSTAQQASIDAKVAAQLLTEHADVNLSGGIVDGNVLVWDANNGEWLPGAAGGGGDGSGTADFPDTYFTGSGIGQAPAGYWLGTNEMFAFESVSNDLAYRGSSVLPVRIENLTWNNLLYETNNDFYNPKSEWTNETKADGDWGIISNPQSFNVSSIYAWEPSSSVNTSIENWLATLVSADDSGKTYGKYNWDNGNTYYTEGVGVVRDANPDNGITVSFSSHSLFGTGIANPPAGSDFTFEEFSFVNNWENSYGKFVGPAVDNGYSSQANAEADGWTVVQWSSSGTYYYPSTSAVNDTPIAMPFSWTLDGVSIAEFAFSSSSGLCFLPSATEPYQYPINSYVPIEERWAANSDVYYLAVNDYSSVSKSSRCMYKVVNESPYRTLVFRWTLNAIGVRCDVEFSIRETDGAFQLLFTPLNLLGFDGTPQEKIESDLAAGIYSANVVNSLNTAIVGPGGAFVTQDGYLCDKANMNSHPYLFETGFARLVTETSTNYSYMVPQFSAMGDVTDGAVGTVLSRSSSGYEFVDPVLIAGFLTDVSYNEELWVYDTYVATPNNGNGEYDYDPVGSGASSSYRIQVSRYDVNGTDHYAAIAALVNGDVVGVNIDGNVFNLQLNFTFWNTGFGQPQYWELYWITGVGDHDAYLAYLNGKDLTNTTYAPTFIFADPILDGQVLAYDIADGKWKPADAGGLSDGDYGDITVGGGGTTLTIDAAVVDNTKLADMANATIKGRSTAGAGAPEDLTAAQVKGILNYAINDLSDVTITTGAAGEVLRYNGAAWVDAQLDYGDLANTPALVTDLDGLNDVTITAPSTGEVLRYNGSAWVDAQLDYGDLSGTPALVTDLDGLSDVTISAAATGEVLRYNGSAWVDAQLAYTDLSGTPGNLSDFTNDVGFITDIVLDTTPQLGGDLDVNGSYIISTANGNVSIAPNGTGLLEVRGNTNDGSIKLNCTANAHGVTIKSPPHAAAATYTLVLPTSAGSVDQVLKTDGSGNLSWVDQSGGGATALNDLTDVNITAASTGEVLRYNGAAWVDAQLAYADLSGTPTNVSSFANDSGYLIDITGEPIDDLSNVSLTGVTTGDVLSYNGANWVNSAAPPANISGSSINGLNDVDTSTSPPVNGDGLIWNSGSGQWEPGAVGTGTVALNGLTDVTITSAATGEVLRYDGSTWVDAQLAYSDLSGTPALAPVATSGDYNDLTSKPSIPVNINDLGDVTVTNVTSGEILEYDGSAWVNVANSGGTSLTVRDKAGTGGAVGGNVLNVSTLSFNSSNGFGVTDLGNGEAFIELGSSFAPWQVSGQTTLTPAGEEPIEFVAGANIAITTNANTSPKQIIFAASNGGANLINAPMYVGRGDGGDLDTMYTYSAFTFGWYGGGDIDTTTDDLPIEKIALDLDGGNIT